MLKRLIFTGIVFFVSSRKFPTRDPRHRIMAFLPETKETFYRIEKRFLQPNITLEQQFKYLMRILQDEDKMMAHVFDYWFVENHIGNHLHEDAEELFERYEEPKECKEELEKRIFLVVEVLREAVEMKLKMIKAGYIPHDDFLLVQQRWLKELHDNYTVIYNFTGPVRYTVPTVKNYGHP
uniref:Uncharacterized protein n=1 Tax=Clastoptera arizonana TaxID=38151 RepID=A0A1B6CEZ4_9HEMI